MSETTIILLVTAFFIGQLVLMALIFRWVKRREALLRAHCAAAGWRFEQSREGRRTVTTIESPHDGWRLRITVRGGGSSGGSVSRMTEWTDPALALDHGLSVLALDLPGGRAGDVERFAGMMQGKVGGKLVSQLLGAEMAEATELKAVELEGSPGALMATPGAEDALRPVALHPALTGAGEALPRGGMPAVVRSREGLTLKVKRALHRPEEVEAMVELGRTLASALRQSET